MVTIKLNPVPPLFNTVTGQPERQCLNCKHLNRGDMASCKAFPNGIPYPIMRGDIAHDEPYPTDNGIQWEAAEDAPLGLSIETARGLRIILD